MLNFKIFKIPVCVEPFFWLGAFFVGGGIGANSREDLTAIAFAMLAVFISILVHELGHALTSRKFTKVNPSIRLVAMGGLATPNTHLTRKQSFWVTWAGPLAGFALFGLTVLGLVLKFGPANALHFTGAQILPKFEPELPYFIVASQLNFYAFSFITTMLFANFWWSALNLLPVFPLDGGQIYASIEESPVKIFRVGMIAGGLAALAFLLGSRPIGAMLFGYLAYQNYQRLQQIKASGGSR